MPSKKPTKKELGIPTSSQSTTLREVKRLAEISQANRVLEAASRLERRRLKNTKQTQTEQELYIEAEIVDSSDSEQEQEVEKIAEVIPTQEDAYNLSRSFWILTGILLALWIRLLL
jgi:hypothetical protein